MKFNRLLVYLTIIIVISNILSKSKGLKNSNNKKPKNSNNENENDADLMLLEKYMQLKGDKESDKFDDNEENTLDSNEIEYREDVLFNTQENNDYNDEEDVKAALHYLVDVIYKTGRLALLTYWC